MIAVQRWLDESGVKARMVMQVHDELVFEVEQGALAVVEKEAPLLMSAAAKLKVPLVVDVGTGSNWQEAH
jgi:DNA polymerase I